MTNPRTNTNRRKNHKTTPVVKDYRPTQPYVVAVPINGHVETFNVNATNGSAAIMLCKVLLVEEGTIAASQDIRFVSRAVKVTAQVGDKFGDGDLRAAKEARELVGV